MDIGTIIGIISGFGLVLSAILVGGELIIFINIPSILIVFGGTVATTLIKFKLSTVFGTFKVVKKAFQDPKFKYEMLIDEIVRTAQKAKREGLLGLEDVQMSNQFLQKGVRMAIDGLEGPIIESVMKKEMAFIKRRHKTGQDLFKGMGDSAPAFGMIGTLIGLVQMLTNMSDPSSIGPAMAVALLTTLYGAVLSNVIFLPIADKLSMKSSEETLTLEIVTEGISSIVNGIHPSMVEEKLHAFIEPKLRKSSKEKK